MTQKKNETHPATPTLPGAPALPSHVTEALALLDQVNTLLGLTAQNVTAKQRRSATRSRKGMEKVIPTLANLSTEHGLSVPKQSTSAMTMYGMLKKVAHRDPQLTSQLAPVQQFFTYRSPAVKKAHPKQKSKKAALKADNEAAVASAAAPGTDLATTAPVAAAPSASTNATPVAPANVVAPHSP